MSQQIPSPAHPRWARATVNRRAGPATALEVGQKAPDFTIAGTGGKPVKLSEMLGNGPIVIYTFIQAFTGT